MSVAQAMKRIPLIKFPLRHPKPSSGTTSQPQVASITDDANHIVFSRSNVSTASSTSPLNFPGNASAQLKRTPLSDEEIEAVMMGGCF